MSYDGFISYSHAADDLLAPRLQAALQRFAKPWWQRRALRIFRDESSLSANPHLWESITEALDESEWFVLLLSPEAAQSEWVANEITYFVEHKGAERILPVVTAGEFGWEGDVEVEAVPEALRDVFTAEPRWVDLRFAKGEQQLDLKDPRFADAVADLASAMRGIPKDDLAGEEVKQYRRTVRTAWGAGAVLVLSLVAAVWAGVVAASNAEEARANAEAEAEARVVAEEQTRLAEESAEEALVQRLAAEEARVEAVEEAERADASARRLLDTVLTLPDPQNVLGVGVPEAVTPPVDPIPRTLPPSDLPVAVAMPSTPRLDFWQQHCFGGSCFRLPMVVDEAAGLRIRIAGDRYMSTDWLASESFHVRHGFTGLASSDPAELLSEGYSVRLYVRLDERADVRPFDVGSVYLYEADYVAVGEDDSCGPELYAGSEPCVEWVFEFDSSFPAGAYVFAVEWTAPCAAWVDTDVCESPARPVSLLAIGGTLELWDEERTERFIVDDAGIPRVEWPYDPWKVAEPIPEVSP